MLDIALLIMRIVLGAIFAAHGAQKLFGWFGGPGMTGWTNGMRNMGVAHPVTLARMNALVEFGGGVLIILGLLTPLAAALIISAMVVAIVYVHAKNGFFSTNKGYEFNLSLIALALALVLTGAGTISVDHLLGIAVPLNLVPAWIVAVLIVVMASGVIMTDVSKRMKAQPTDVGHRQGV